ncbi:MAG: glycosyltransferase family 4 protein [Candidatus Sulfotelmatobacter sp.]|jgi:glycosyltransferase involved in cell wall biosynthesis
MGSTPNTPMRREVSALGFEKKSASCLQVIPARSLPVRVAVIGNHLPRQCGIATFTTDLCDAIAAAAYGGTGVFVVAVNDSQSRYSYPSRVRFEITESDLSSYQAAADFLNSSDIDLVCLQHEYGIFGGKSGSHVLRLLQRLKMPVVSTLHTVLREPDIDQRMVMQEIAARCDRLIVMSQHSSHFLQDAFRVPSEKIELIPHGIPDLPFAEPASYKDAFSIGKTVLLTFGLLSPNKGFESVIRALPRILSRHNNVIYVIAGATHPHVKRREGDRYRLQLQALAKELGVEENVVFHNRFVSPQEMASLVSSADIYVTPYRYEAQAVSGTLAYALGAGKAIISTPYWHAAELLADGRGALVPFEDPSAIADTAIELLDNDAAREAMRKRAYAYARHMVWNRVAQSYMQTFVRVRSDRMQPARAAFHLQAAEKNATSRLINV